MAQAKTSFRDPSGQLIETEHQILRKLLGSQLVTILDQSSVVHRNIQQENLISYKNISTADEILLQHPKVWFPSYPFEWTYAMLHDSASLTLNLAIELLDEGLGIKDATPYNILFQGPRPIFVDIASIEKRSPLDPIWLPLAQFHRMFILPMLMQRKYGLSFHEAFLARADGLTPEYCVKYGKKFDLLSLSQIVIPAALSKCKISEKQYEQKLSKNKDIARLVLKYQFKKNTKTLKKLAHHSNHSSWSSYMSSCHYSDEAFKAKNQWISQILDACKPKAVLDVGCNSGYFSKLAAENGANVVAIDSDPTVVNDVYQMSAEKKLSILPLVVNFSRPSPAIGWKNNETWSFLDRAAQKFDMVFMLAVIHHMLVTDRIPMIEIAKLVRDITTTWAVIEFVAPEDPMFVKILRGRQPEDNFDSFKFAFSKYFAFEKVFTNGSRTLSLLKRI